ncbi:hypothetical protein LEP1GSC171_1320 [Leptospira santarosai str. HAI1380]|nr:hypothetical protein LEP1GSC171_1320 [Leptospira santarosai str. HAI1380]
MRQNKFTKIQFDIADDGITNRSTIGGKAWVFEPVSNTCNNRNLIGKLKTLQAVSAKSLSKNFKNLIQKLRLSEFLQQTLDEETDSSRASTRKRQNLWELLQQTLSEETGMQIQKTESKGLGMNLNTSKIMNIGFEGGKRISIQNTSPVKNRFSLRTKLVSLVMLLTFAVVFVIPLTIFEELHAQSVPTLGSTKQFASDELKPYVDAAKAGSSDSGTFLNTVTNGEQVIEAAWETGVNAEIEAILGGVTTSDSVNNVNVYKDAVRAQLELQKQQAKSRWLADVNAYVQAELQIFLAALSQNTSNNVTASNTNAVNTINPTVQATTTTPVSQATNPAQAAQSYYQGSQLWDTKWQDLLSKQNTWEQNSLSAIQTGILQWNQSITGLENDKLTYLNGIEQTKAQWLANKQIIQNAQTQMRGALQSTITNIRSQENQLKANASSDPGLTSVFGDMDELLEDLQDALNSNASLGTLAQTLGNFFSESNLERNHQSGLLEHNQMARDVFDSSFGF